MFTTFNNNTEIINNALQSDCVTIKLFGLTTKLPINDLVMFMFGLVICVILADMLADYMLFNIEDAKKKKEETDALLKEIKILQEENNAIKILQEENNAIKILQEENNAIKILQEENKDLKVFKGLKKVPSETIIQCDNCYNEFCETEIKTRKIIGQIYQQYCINCFYAKSIRKSQSDTKLNYQ
jgi:hypothetical protein